MTIDPDPHGYFDLLLKVEPGLNGAKVHIGLGNYENGLLGEGGSAITLSSLYTWGHPIGGVEPNQTYLGVELELMAMRINAVLGLYSHVAGKADGPEWIFSGGIGIGF